MTNKKEKISWGAERRQEYIEFRVFWSGSVNRSDLMDRFGVSTPQASVDLSNYQQFAPGNLVYDSSKKTYLATNEFQPKILKPNADRYLSQLQSIADGIVDQGSTWMTYAPNCDALSLPMKRVEPLVLRELINTIRAKQSIGILYQSMNAARPDPIWRRITPHSFAFDGLRWHVRAFCHRDLHFKDFVLSRFIQVMEPGVAGQLIESDTDWQTFLDVRLAPNPRLSPAQKAAIASDYGMTGEELTVSVRRSLLFYFNKRFRLDFLKYDDDPAQNPLHVVNRDELDEALLQQAITPNS